MTYLATLHDPCLFCGHTWHKHTVECQLYQSLDLERCQLQHSLFLRGCGGGEPYEYECNLCSVPPIFSDEEIEQSLHPLCAKGIHYWGNPCDMGCCPIRCCSCGVKK